MKYLCIALLVLSSSYASDSNESELAESWSLCVESKKTQASEPFIPSDHCKTIKPTRASVCVIRYSVDGSQLFVPLDFPRKGEPGYKEDEATLAQLNNMKEPRIVVEQPVGHNAVPISLEVDPEPAQLYDNIFNTQSCIPTTKEDDEDDRGEDGALMLFARSVKKEAGELFAGFKGALSDVLLGDDDF